MVQAFRRVVVVEDRTDQDLVGVFCAKVVGIDVWQQAQRRLAFCYSKGNPWKQQDISRLRAMLQQMIAVDGPALELFVIADRDYHPDLEKLRAALPHDHITWHVWERAEIENYLLCAAAIKRMIGDAAQQPSLDRFAFQTEYDRLIDSSRATASDRLVQAYDEWRRRAKESYDASTMSRMAREYLETHWDRNRLGLADAKSVVLPGIKRWLQVRQFGQFSDRRLAENLDASELPPEIHDLAWGLIEFAGLQARKDDLQRET